MFVADFFDDSLGVQALAILVQNGLKLVPSKALTIVSGFKPWHFLYRMDLNYNESPKGNLRVHSLAVFATDFFDAGLGSSSFPPPFNDGLLTA